MLQLVVECSKDEVDVYTSLLEEQGALSVTYTDKYDSPILEPEIGTTPIWNDVCIHAIFADDSSINAASLSIKQKNNSITYKIESIPEKDWVSLSQQNFAPIHVGDSLCICPSWIDKPKGSRVYLNLDPGLAFGTGTHATTYLCLEWLVKTNLKDKTLVDYGTGSGILAIAALKLGAKSVQAVDIDKQALIATEENAKRNDLDLNKLAITYPDKISAKYDIIVANILFGPLLDLEGNLNSILKNEGVLVVSGVLKEQVDGLIKAYKASYSHIETKTREDWALVVMRKKIRY